MPRVAIVMGSDSDWTTMQRCAAQLQSLGIEPHVEVMSAHRGPARVAEFAESAKSSGVEVIIAAAGMSAALAGTIAAHTTLPVIGVPIASGSLNGMDALLSTVQMPPGVPVAAMAIGDPGATNAAILAAQIIALHDERVAAALQSFKTDQAAGVTARNAALQTKRRSDRG
ncbi:MAG: 5-(carboxyamino)imidazole ribonucleotide mutase [Phycisphaerales bacterium]|nr:5-(carboxyamino)imidazole ribonucleotide mutase [Phycisphaerales bacterium]